MQPVNLPMVFFIALEDDDRPRQASIEIYLHAPKKVELNEHKCDGCQRAEQLCAEAAFLSYP
jgi:hypothetical protein